MVNFLQAVQDKIKQSFCSISGTAYDLLHLLSPGGVIDPLGVVGWSEAVRAAYCNTPVPYPPPQPPFTGGQCCDKSYLVTVQATFRGRNVFGECTGEPGQPVQSQSVLTGKILSVKGEDVPSFNAARVVATVQSCSGATSQVALINAGQSCYVSHTVTVVPADGSADTCGNPEAPYPSPSAPNGEWNRRSGDITYTNNDGVDVTVPIVLLFGYAQVDLDANISVPVKINVGPINFNASFNLKTGDINLFPRNNYYGDRRPGDHPIDFSPLPGEDVPPYPPSLPPSAPPIDEEEPGEERVIVGALVTVLSEQAAKVGTLYQQDNPDISIPNLGYISFLCRLGKVLSGWTEDIPVKNRRHFIPCPWEGGAFKVGGTPRPGITWDITPIYSAKRSAIVFPEVS